MMSTPTPSLRIAVLGTGKIGSAFASQLARPGCALIDATTAAASLGNPPIDTDAIAAMKPA